MKFTADALFQIYMDGSLTDEAQAEFDKLMRRDPEFCQKVTRAVAERMGPAPDPLLDKSLARLDGKIETIWRENKPFPRRWRMESAAKFLLLAFAGTALVIGFQKGMMEFHSSRLENEHSPGQTKPLSSADGKSPALPNGARGGKLGTLVLKKGAAINKKIEDSSTEFGGSDAMRSSKVSSPHFSGSGEVPGSQQNPMKDDGKNGIGDSGAMSTQEGDAIRVQIESDKAQKVVVTVLDSKGRQIRGLYQGPWSEGVHWLEWDGKDDLGTSVTPGDYTVILNADGKLMSGVVAIQPAR